MIKTKQELRNDVLARRAKASIVDSQSLEQNRLLLTALIKLVNLCSAQIENPNIGLYWPLSAEPDLLKLCFMVNANFALPKIRGDMMDFVEYRPDSALEPSMMSRVMQPASGKKLVPDIIIIPALAYDLKGNRLGFGKGYYDKYITYAKSLSPARDIVKIGVCFQQYLFQQIERAPHDLQLDYLVTDSIIVDYTSPLKIYSN